MLQELPIELVKVSELESLMSGWRASDIDLRKASRVCLMKMYIFKTSSYRSTSYTPNQKTTSSEQTAVHTTESITTNLLNLTNLFFVIKWPLILLFSLMGLDGRHPSPDL